MKKIVLLTFSFTVLFCLSLHGQKSKDPGADKAHGNSGEGRTNLLLPFGNIGIGTLQPSVKLEVVGDARFNQQVFIQQLQSVGLSTANASVAEDLSVGKNVFIKGNVGIGVERPAERLEINGNLRVTESIFAAALEVNALTTENGIFNQNLTVKENLRVEGLTGLGVAAPVERLEVDGNIKATQNIIAAGVRAETGSFTSGVDVGENLITSGNIGIGIAEPTERLEVSGNMRVSQTIYAGSLETGQLNFESGAVDGQLSIGGNTLIHGSLGIGIAAPVEKLEVAGNIKATGNLSAANLSAAQGAFSQNVSIQQDLSVAGTADFRDVTANDLTVQKLNLNNSLSVGSSLGIGIATPAAALHVVGDGKFEGNITAVKLTVQELEVANFDMGNQEGGQFSFEDDLFVSGSVGIGTEKVEGYTLSVNGKIRASDDIKVYPAAEWADFVFAEDYRLRPLNELAAYIRANKHLPDMPSAAQVEKEGIHLGEMDARLLQKIEELTLHLIRLEKENKAVKAYNQQLMQQNKRLQKDVSQIRKALGMQE